MDALSDGEPDADFGEPGAAFGLRGRRAELEALRDRLDDVRDGRGGIVLVTGMPGLGKTALLDAAQAMARERGIKVLRGTGNAAGQVIPYGLLLEALVTGPGAPVGPDALDGVAHSPDQRFWMLREVQESLERFALRAPALIAIDDVQWADVATLMALGTLPRQLAPHQILWLLTSRPAEPAPAARTALARLEAAGALKVTLAPLDQGAVAGVTQDVLGGVPDPALERVLADAQGNPFLLTERLRGMREKNLVNVDGGTVRFTGRRTSFRFVDSVRDQVRRLSPDARNALQMACVLGRPSSAEELAGLTDVTLAAIRRALREALAAGLVAGDGDRVAFRHDLVHEAVDATLSRAARQRLRRRAIYVLLRQGAPPSAVVQLVVNMAEPLEAIAALRRAAVETRQVSPAVASQLSRRALGLLPPGQTSPRLTAETIGYLMEAGQVAAAVKLMTTARSQAQVRLGLACLSMQYSPADVVWQCQRALTLPGVPVEVRIQLLSVLSMGLEMTGDVTSAEKAARDAAEAARASGDRDNEVIPLVPRATQALARGHWRRALDLAGQAAVGKSTVQGPMARLWMPASWQALICIAVARLDEALALIDAGMRAAQRDGLPANIRAWSMLRCRALFGAGRLEDARAEAEAMIEMADELGDGSYGYLSNAARYILGQVALHTGDPAGLAEARQIAARLGQANVSLPGQRLGAWLMALAADAGGNAALAAQAGAQVLDPLAHGPLSATSPRMYADSAALTRILLQAGRRAEAASVVTRLEGFAKAHPDFPFLECAAVHARAVLGGDPKGALRAVALSSSDPRPLVRAAVLEDAGRLLPDARAAEAVPLLENALASYVAAGAERDAARVRGLLRARGIRPPDAGPRSAPGWPEITESEFSVVSLVVQGATNREVAERLDLSPYTVNSHLRHVLAKLGIRSRAELARLTAERQAPGQRSESG